MKNKINLLGMAIIAALFIVSISYADDCKEAEALIDKAFAGTPDEMTEQYIEMAVQQCPENAGLFRRIAQCYEKWYKKELNAKNQAQFKELAQNYYRKALKVDDGANSKELKTELTKLENTNEFNEVTFRALRPSSSGKTGTGLNLDVHFDRNSFELSDTVHKHLDILGKVLADKESITISLEGHTDMSGTAGYNQSLSVKRATEVKEYLVNTFNISSDRINTNGYGFDRLFDQEAPYSRANRRVEVIKLSE